MPNQIVGVCRSFLTPQRHLKHEAKNYMHEVAVSCSLLDHGNVVKSFDSSTDDDVRSLKLMFKWTRGYSPTKDCGPLGAR